MGQGLADASVSEGQLEPVAVVGYAFRFPQEATSTSAFWDLMLQGRNTSSQIPPDRLAVDNFRGTNADSIPVSGGHFLSGDVAAFDPTFFRMTKAEANGLDPQQRMLLETTYQALENAGLTLDQVSQQRASVHVGSSASDYAAILSGDPINPSRYGATGVAQSFLANRLSWFFNLTGPSMTVDTACSSSLTALDLSCRLIQNGDVPMGIVAGSNLSLAPYFTICMGLINALSPDNRCFSFDSRANGYSRGEGVGVLVLKRVSDAVRCGDPIRAIIRSVASNHDGRTSIMTQPRKTSQERLIRETYARANLDPEDTTFCEAHATGTPVGDPIEVSAIASAFTSRGTRKSPLIMGALKANIGHLEAASGVAAIIKSIITLEKGIIPPIADLQTLNPQIEESLAGLQFPREPMPWPKGAPRRISVNSFGIGGQNAHAIIEGAMASGAGAEAEHISSHPTTSSSSPPGGEARNGVHQTSPIETSPPRLYVLSAADEAGVKRLASAYALHFSSQQPMSLKDHNLVANLEHTLCSRRTALPWRSFVVADSADPAHFSHTRLSKPLRSRSLSDLVFVFTGQGAQWAEMGRQLLSYPSFRNTLHAAGKHMAGLGAPWVLVDELTEPAKTSRISEASLAQPLCTALQIALVDLLRGWNIFPSSVVGHSSGEIAAAYSAGAISRRSAWTLAYFRGSLVAEMRHRSGYTGAMLASALSWEDAQSHLEALRAEEPEFNVSVGCINSPNNVTFTGQDDKIDELARRLEANKVFVKKLKVDVAYHSPQTLCVADLYRRSVGLVERGERLEFATNMISTVTGQTVTAAELQSIEYWVQNLTRPVQFSDAMTTLVKNTTCDVVVEIGPHGTLRSAVQEIVASALQDTRIPHLAVLKRGMDSIWTLKTFLGQLWSTGYPLHIASAIDCGGAHLKGRHVLTDLPAYPFDHSKSYWHEGSLSKGYRFRPHPRLELLGSPVADWSPLQPRWRNILRISELPWIAHHKLNGTILCPGAGMLVMAIEAVRQVAEQNSQLSSVCIKNAHFHSALAFANSESELETQFMLDPVHKSAGKSYDRFRFQLNTLQGGQWRVSCDGIVQANYQIPANPIDEGHENRSWADGIRREFREGYAACSKQKNPQQMYDNFRSSGFDYGTAFQQIEAVSVGNDNKASVKVRMQRSELTGYRYLIHPGTLDSILQLALVTTSSAGDDISATHVATDVGDMWISCDMEDDSDNLRSDVFAKYDGSTGECNMTAVFGDNQTPCLSIKKFKTQVIASEASNKPPKTVIKGPGCFKQVLKPDIILLSPAALRGYCLSSRATENAEPIILFQDFQLVAISYILDIDRWTAQHRLHGAEPHLLKYVAWVSAKAKAFADDKLPLVDPRWKFQLEDRVLLKQKRDSVHASGAQGRLLVELMSRALDILEGKAKALDLMFSGPLARDYYAQGFVGYAWMEGLKRFYDIFAHKNPGMQILEIGAGTGGMTGPLLELIGGEQQTLTDPMFGHYDFTDLSPSFLIDAKRRFAQFQKIMSYKILNIDEDPIAQGFEPASYDLVIAASVLHATRDLGVTIQNIHKVIKPGGKLVIVEVTEPDVLATPVVWGLVEGWWQSTDDRRDGPCVSEASWNHLLIRHGFTGCETILPDFESSWGHWTAAIITTALPDSPVATPNLDQREVYLVYDKNSEHQQAVAHELEQRISPHCRATCPRLSLQDDVIPTNVSRADYVCLHDIDTSLIANIHERAFKNLQNLFASARSLLWVSSPSKSQDSFEGLVDGFMRVMRTEHEDVASSTLRLEPCDQPPSVLAEHILAALNSLRSQSASGNYERELYQKDGIVNIPRYVNDAALNSVFAESAELTRTQRVNIPDAPPFKLRLGKPGLLNTLYYEQTAETLEELGSEDVEIDTVAAGINFKDVLAAMGRINSAIGIEVAGTIRGTGTSVSRFAPGDRVVAITESFFANKVRCHSDLVVKVPENLSLEEAAGFAISGTTAYYSLCKTARLSQGETILIHSAAGATGQAALQYAKYVGAEIFVTVGSLSKRDFVRDHYGIPESHILYSRDETFAQGVMRLTSGKGVDVVLNSLSGPLLFSSWECIAPFGRFVEIGKREILQKGSLPMEMFDKNVTFHAVDLSVLASHRPKVLQECLSGAMALAETCAMSISKPLQLFKLSEVEKAFRHLQSGKSTGKLVVTMHPDEEVEVAISKPVSSLLSANATYIVVGAFGGVGQQITSWMVERGARHLLLLSRAGLANEEAKMFVDKLEKLGITVKAPSIDVCSFDQVQAALDMVKDMPPIRGCIQAAVVLHDGMFKDMDLPDWKAVLSPKLHGTHNLHTLLPRTIDFFILLSSGTGVIGNHGQSNYAAGNTYQDALARYRTRQGLRTVSLDLTLVEDVNSLAVTERQAARLKSTNMITTMTFNEIAILLERYCQPDAPLLSEDDCQPIMGIKLPADVLAEDRVVRQFLNEPGWRPLWQMPASDLGGVGGNGHGEEAGQQQAEMTRRFASTDYPSEAGGIVANRLAEMVARGLSIEKDEIDLGNALHAYGVDSLIAVEIKHRLLDDFATDVAIFDILGENTTFQSLGMTVANRSLKRRRRDV